MMYALLRVALPKSDEDGKFYGEQMSSIKSCKFTDLDGNKICVKLGELH